MDVQNGLNLFSTLNSASRPVGSLIGQNWSDALNLAPADLAVSAPSTAQPLPSEKAFANLLDKAIEARPAQEATPEAKTKEKQLREKFEILVNKFFIGTMLKQMRDSSFKSELFSGGKGGEAFGGLMDQQLAENAGGKVAKSLVDSMVRHAMGTKGDPDRLYLDSQQQKQLQEYRHGKRVNHDVPTSFTA